MTTIGFTGTQRGMTQAQIGALWYALQWYHLQPEHGPIHGIHGDCIGADEQFGALVIGFPGSMEITRPGLDSAGASPKRANRPATLTYPPEPYLDRNHKIVDQSDVMLAAPGEPEEQLRSGTWATIRYARRQNRPLMIIYPDGSTSA